MEGKAKVLKRWGKVGQGVGALKKGGRKLEPPYELYIDVWLGPK